MVDSVIQIGEPFNLFHDIDGNPLEDGYIYIGQSGLDPISNPITVYSDYALTLPIAQPIRTEGGYPMIGGTPAKIYAALGYYSITVLNKRGTLIYTDLVVEYPGSSSVVQFSSLQSAADADLIGLDSIQTVGFYDGWSGSADGPKGGALYFRDGTNGAASTIYANNLGFYDANGSGFHLAVENEFDVFKAGAVCDGVTDDSAAWQSALDFIATDGGKIVFSGHSVIGSQLLFSGKSLHIEGTGIETCSLICSNSNGVLSATFITVTIATDYFTLSNLTILCAGPGDNGEAVTVTFPPTQTLPSSPQCLIENVAIRGNLYAINTATDPYFTRLIKFINCAATTLRSVLLSQIGNELCTAIEIDNTLSQSAFYLNMDNVVAEGNNYAIYSAGWIESVHLTNCEIASPSYGVYMVNNSATAHLPLIRILNTHINSVKTCVFVQNFRDILISGCNMTCFNDVRNTTEATVRTINAVDCFNVSINSGFYAIYPTGTPGVATVGEVIALVGCIRSKIQDCDIDVSLGGAQAAGYGVAIGASSSSIMIQDNEFRSDLGSVGITYVLAQPGLLSNERIVTQDNTFHDGGIGVHYLDMNSGRIQSNTFNGTTTPILIQGGTIPNSANLLINGNFPQQTQSITDNSATPSVGSALNSIWDVSNTIATNITDFLDHYDHQEIVLYFSNNNTTIVHGGGIFTTSGANIAATAGQILQFTWMYGVWRQV